MNCGVGKHFFWQNIRLDIHKYKLGEKKSNSHLHSTLAFCDSVTYKYISDSLPYIPSDSLLQTQMELDTQYLNVPFEFETRSPKGDTANIS